MLGFGKKDDDDDKKKDAQTEQLSQAMRQMSEQIAQTQQKLDASEAKVEELTKKLSASEAKVSDLTRKLGTAQADDRADDSKLRAAEQKVAALEAELGKAKTAAQQVAQGAKTAAATVAAANLNLHIGGAAWVRKAGGKGLNRRAAPGTSAQVHDAFVPGTLLAVLEGPQSADNYTWYKVVAADGRSGWVAGEELVTKPE